MLAQNDTQMPQLPMGFSGVRYSKPFGQSLFTKEYKIKDIFADREYYSDELNKFNTSDFSVKKIFDQYMAEVSI